MTGWIGNVDGAAWANEYFREVLFTSPRMQLVLMSLQPGEEIGLEVHDEHDQFLHLVSGRATVTMGPSMDEVTEAHDADSGWGVVIPAGTWHNVINRGEVELKLFTLYAPPQHPEGTVHRTRADATEAELA